MFTIKTEPSILKGPSHVLDIIQNSRYLPKHLKKIIDPVNQRNSYFVHFENILIALLGDEDQSIRTLAVLGQNYIDLIGWFDENYDEPPLTKDFREDLLKEFVVDTKNNLRITKSHSSCRENRDGIIRTTLASRKEKPVFETKEDFFK